MRKNKDRLIQTLGFTFLGMIISLAFSFIINFIGNKIGQNASSIALAVISAIIVIVAIPTVFTLIRDIFEKNTRKKKTIEISINIDDKIVTLKASNLEEARQLLQQYSRLNPTLKTKDNEVIRGLSTPNKITQDSPKEKVIG